MINNRHAISDCLQRLLNALVLRNGAQVFVGTERGEMALLVAFTEGLKNLFKHARFGFRDALLAQVDADRTQRGSLNAEDV